MSESVLATGDDKKEKKPQKAKKSNTSGGGSSERVENSLSNREEEDADVAGKKFPNREEASSSDAESRGEGDGRKVTMISETDFRRLAELKEAFHLFDINRDGLIDKEDLKFTFTSMGRPDMSCESIDQMLSEMSRTDPDRVDFDAFVERFGYRALELDPEEELLSALSKWDYHGNGMISEEILKRDLRSWGDKFTELEAECALEEAPVYKKDGTTMIDYVKFCNNICGLRNVERTRRIEREANDYEEELKSLAK